MVTAQSRQAATLHELRHDKIKRSDYIEEQLFRSRNSIRLYVARHVFRHKVEEVTKDACTEFCIGAWRAILSFDGRGELGAFVCQRGMYYVFEYIRRLRGRRSPRIDYQASSLDEMLDSTGARFETSNNEALVRSPQPSVEDIVISDEAVSRYLKALNPREQEVVHLILDGSANGKVMRCHCNGRHSLTRDLCEILGLKTSTVEKVLIGLRKTVRSVLQHE